MLGPFVTAQDFSVMVVRLTVEDQWIGGVTLMACGKNRFSKEHMRLFSLLRDPFGIALSNFRRYQELLAHKERLADDKRYLEKELRRDYEDAVIGAESGLKTVMQRVEQVSRLDTPVLLLGETGVGKEIIASALHNGSPRKKGPFVKVNCGAIPESLIDSELFGFEKGAFTGAAALKRGRFERAHGGTLFLDEVGELPPKVQVRLLRVLQEKEIERVGGSESIPVDIRIIAATHRDLPAMIEKGDFRQDLYFRLQVFPITIPPLRKRPQDIPALAAYFVAKKSQEIGLTTIPALDKRAFSSLVNYRWPGNIRELENAIERACILCGNGPLKFLDLGLSEKNNSEAGNWVSDEKNYRLDDVLRKHIDKVLELTNGKVGGVGGAAALLAVNESTLRHKMRKLGIKFGRNRR
jgi:transcriptional regulator with GAF, ATPase, and Fis domain